MRLAKLLVLMIVVTGIHLTPAIVRGDDAPILTEDDGPFLVFAYNFRGPAAKASANALALELRTEHNLPAFVHETIRRNGESDFDVFVGNCKTTKEVFDLTNRVKKTESKTLAADPALPVSDFQRRRKSLSRAIATRNPLNPLK